MQTITNYGKVDLGTECVNSQTQVKIKYNRVIVQEELICLFSLCLSKRCQLLGFLSCFGLGTLVELGLGLETHDTATPLSEEFGVLVVLLSGQVSQQLELGCILLANIGQTDNSGVLLVYKGSEARLVLNNHERNLHLTAESRHPHDEFDGVDITCDQDKLGLLLLDKGGDVLESELDNIGDLVVSFLSSGSSGSSLLDSLLLGGRGLRAVLVEKSEDSHGFVLAQSFGELVDCWGDLKTLVQNSALTLDADILRPTNETTEITALGADVSSNSSVASARGEKRIGGLGGLWLLDLRFLSNLIEKENSSE